MSTSDGARIDSNAIDAFTVPSGEVFGLVVSEKASASEPFGATPRKIG
jgi:hypothetical protein